MNKFSRLNGRWRKSTYSLDNGNCVEVRMVDNSVELRDSKDRSGPVLRFTPHEWERLVFAITNGQRAA